MLVSFTDKVEIKDAKRLGNGQMVFDAAVARVGVYRYHGSELGRPELGMVGVFRPESSIFDEASLASLAHVTVTDDHPTTDVTPKNWRDLSRGWTEGQIARDGNVIRVPMLIADAGLQDKIDAGKAEVSPGYRADITEQTGVHDGESYQFVMGPPRYNHVAVVDKARGGSKMRLGDSWPSTPIIGDRTVTTKTIIFDGVPIEATDAAAAAITKLQSQVTDAAAAHAVTIAAKDSEIGKQAAEIVARDAKIAELEKTVADSALTPARLDAAVAARTLVVDSAKKLIGSTFVADGKTEAQIRKEAVTAKIGDKAATMSDESIIAAFDTLAALIGDSKNEADPIRDALNNGGGQITDAETRAKSARQKMIDALTNPDAAEKAA